MPTDKRVQYRMSAQEGGRYPIGGEVWTKQDEDNFRWWYDRMSKYKGLNPDPDDIEQYYDYRGFWREDPKRAESMLKMDATQHFIDKWKYPGHPTFSNESIYSNDRTPGGSWVEHEGKFYYKPSFYTSGYLDRTREYLRGTDEGIAIEGENGTEYILIPKMPDGGYVASRDNTSVGAPGIDANARVGNRIYQPVNIAETIAGFVPGVGDVLDARDFMRAAANRDRVGMALAAAAFIPLAGDALQEYFKLRRRRKFLEEVPLKEGNKKGWDGSKIKESDEELLEDMPEYAHPESPMDEALIAHNSRITSGAYERVTGKSIAGFGNKMRNIKQKYPGIYEKMFDVDNIDIDSKEAEDFLEMFFEEKPGTYKGLSKEGKRELLRKAYIRIYQESPMFKIGVDGDNAIAYSKYSFNNFFGDNPDGLNAGLSHELDHAVWSNADAENMAQMVRESDEWFDAGKITGNDREYLQNPLELSARGSQIKDYFGLADDTQEITPSMLKYAAKHYGETWIDNNMKSFFEGITDWDKAAKWLSKYATVTVPAALIPRLVESGEEDLKDMEDFNRRHGGPANTSVSEDGHVRYLGYRPFFNPMRLYQRRKYIIDKLVADYGLPVVDAEREVDGIMNKSFLDDGYYDVRNKSYGIGGWKGEYLKEFISTYKDGGLADQIDFLAKKIKRMPSGGYIASRDNTSVGSQGIDANANYWNRIYQPINIAEMAAGFVPGVGDIMDARDFMQAAANKDRVGMALAAAAFIPLAGDAVQEYLKMRRLGMFDEIPVGRKKLRDDIKETDEELIEAMPDYADIESPYTEALSYHRVRLKDMESGIDDDAFPFRQRYPGVYDEVFNLDEIDLDKISGDINSAYNQRAAKVAGALAGLNNDQIKELSLSDIKRIIRSGKMASSYSPYFSTVDNPVSGIFGSNRSLIDILGKDVSSPAASHELDHAIWANMDSAVLEKAAKETEDWFDLGKAGNDVDVFKDKANELSARGSQIKDYFGLTEPDQKVTPEMLKYAARNYPNEVMDNNMVSFFNGIKDWDKAAEWITKYSTSVIPAVIVGDMISREEETARDIEQFGIGGRVGGVPVEYISLDGTDKKRGYSPLNGIGLISARARYIKNKLANDYGISKSKVDSLIDGLVRKNMLSSQHYDIKGKSFGIGNWKGEDLKEFVSTYKEGGLVDQIDFLARKMKEGGFKYRDKYDFGPVLDFMLKGEPFEIEGNLRNPYYDEGGLVERQDDLYETLTDEYEMPPIQAIAVIANLTHESGLDPYAEGDSGASLGLQQWRDDRRKALEKFALSRRHSYPTYEDQIAFLMNEYNNGQAFQFTHRGENLYAAGKTKNPTFDYYQFSKNDFENANSLYDAVIAWNQGVGRPTKKYAYNDRRYAIAKSIADRHGIPYGNESFYNEMGFNDDAVIFDDDLREEDEAVDQPTGSDAPAPSGEELFMEQYGNEVVAQMLAMENNARNLYNNTASMIRQHKQSLEEDKKREEESVKEVDERQREREFLAAVLPNLQLNIKGVSQIGRSNG